VRGHLQRKTSCPVILQTPYGPIETPFVALDRDYKLEKGRLVKANAQHDRIQKGESKESVRERNDPQIRRASEVDLLRLGGAFEHLGVHVGPYLLKGYDCPYSSFQFLDFPKYPCPLEIKNRSRGFKYQIKNYPHLPRAVVLCLDHDEYRAQEHVDVVEIPTLAKHFSA